MKILHYKYQKKEKERECFNSFLQTPISFIFAKIYQVCYLSMLHY